MLRYSVCSKRSSACRRRISFAPCTCVLNCSEDRPSRPRIALHTAHTYPDEGVRLVEEEVVNGGRQILSFRACYVADAAKTRLVQLPCTALYV
jgi:hypothetical protein